jgi:serine/threonine protein kinase
MYRCYFEKRFTQEHPKLNREAFDFGKVLYSSTHVKQEWISYLACMCIAEDVLQGKSNDEFYSTMIKEDALWKKMNEVLKVSTLKEPKEFEGDLKIEGDVAVKKVSSPSPRELYFMKALDTCDRITSIKASLYHNNKLFMSMEAGAMDLFDYISIALDEDTQVNMKLFKDILEAIAHMHHHDIVHGDIKPENVLIMSDGRAKVCDFGTCFFQGTLSTSAIGTAPYMAYEMLKSYPQKKYYGKEIDVWSLGCVYMCMKEKAIPYFEDIGPQGNDTKSMIKRCELLVKEIDSMSNTFVTSMLNTIPAFRPTVHELVKVFA